MKLGSQATTMEIALKQIVPELYHPEWENCLALELQPQQQSKKYRLKYKSI